MQLNIFKGISPRTPPHALGEGMAIVARDINLQHGTVKPWREPRYIKNVVGDAMMLEVYGCCTFSWDTCVSVARWLPNCPRLYITGHADYPEVAPVSFDDRTLDYARLGVPNPDTTPLVSYITVPDKSIETSLRTYVFTYVNWLNEESTPSYPSSELAVNDGQSVTVSGWEAQDDSWRVDKVRIYRRASGFNTGSEKEQDIATDFLFVDEVSIDDTTYVDTKNDYALQWAVNTREVKPPPQDLQEITSIDGAAILCGYVGNKLYFTKNHQPWNWPTELEITLDDNIVHLEQDDGELFVSTTGKPYTVEAIPDCGDRPCRTVVKADYPYPDVACGYGHASVITPFGMVYASNDGLVLLSKSQPVSILTEPVLAKDDWVKLRPDTARLAYYKGHIICVTDAVSFMLLIDTKSYKDTAQVVVMTTISDTPVDMVLSDSGELLFLYDDGQLSQWDSGDTYRPYVWISAPILSGSQHWLPVARVNVDGAVDYTIIGENGLSFSRRVTRSTPFRTKRLLRNREFNLRLDGVGEVNYVYIGETMVDEARV